MQPSLDQLGGSPVGITLSDGKQVMVHPLTIDDFAAVKAKIRTQWLARIDADLKSGGLTPAAYARLQRELYTMPITQDIVDGEMTQEYMLPFLIQLVIRKSDNTIGEKQIRAMPLADINAIMNAMAGLHQMIGDPERGKDGDPDADFTNASTPKNGRETSPCS